MSERPTAESDAEQAGEQDEPPALLDMLPVPAGPAAILTPRPGALPERASPVLPAVQAAAAAAGGFVAGAAVVGLVHRRRRSRALKGRSAKELRRRSGRASGAAGELVQIVGSRSLLVDVHLLGGGGRDT